jgi:hypothetical protein
VYNIFKSINNIKDFNELLTRDVEREKREINKSLEELIVDSFFVKLSDDKIKNYDIELFFLFLSEVLRFEQEDIDKLLEDFLFVNYNKILLQFKQNENGK